MADIEETPAAGPAKRGRGRPRKDSEFASLSRELLAQKALEIAGSEGYDALTMHRLAAEFKVTPRALYNYVADRQEVVNLAVERFLKISPLIEFDCSDWKHGVREAYRATRRAYRSYPRASQVVLDEKLVVSPAPRRTELIERVMRFFVDIGLTLQQAVAMVRSLERDVLGFVLQVDYYYDRHREDNPDHLGRPVPADWLDAYPEVPAPLARRALELPAQDNDAMFDELVELRILAMEQMRQQNQAAEAQQEP